MTLEDLALERLATRALKDIQPWGYFSLRAGVVAHPSRLLAFIARLRAAEDRGLTTFVVLNHEDKVVAAPCCLDGCQYSDREARLRAADEHYMRASCDRDRLLQNIATLTGFGEAVVIPSGIAMDEFLEKWHAETTARLGVAEQDVRKTKEGFAAYQCASEAELRDQRAFVAPARRRIAELEAAGEAKDVEIARLKEDLDCQNGTTHALNLAEKLRKAEIAIAAMTAERDALEIDYGAVQVMCENECGRSTALKARVTELEAEVAAGRKGDADGPA